MFAFEIIFGAIIIMATLSITYGIGWALFKFGFAEPESDHFVILLVGIMTIVGTVTVLFLMHLAGHECINLILGKG
jgi:hypothetical protein